MADDIDNVKYEEEFILNSRGLKLFTCRWQPTNCNPKALIFLCHGYAMECSVSMKDAAMRLAKAGFAVHGIDYVGHGKSSGLPGYITSFDDLVDDCSDHFTNISEKKENRKKMRILLGESMGGAVVLLLHRKKPEYWGGAVLMAPMCKIADEMKPSPLVTNVLTKLCNFIPTWRIIPTEDVIDSAFRLPHIREEIRKNPLCYKGRPRLKTGYYLVTVSMDLEQRLHEVKYRAKACIKQSICYEASYNVITDIFKEDKVVDPSVSKLLFEKAPSTDKSIMLYPGMWHSLTYGELPENIDIVFTDVINWLNERTASGNSQLEMEQKQEHDKLHYEPASEV